MDYFQQQAMRIGPKVCYVMSMPRLSFTDNMLSLLGAAANLRIEGVTYSGAFWEQGMERIIEGVAAKDVKYILCMDYDTYYTEYHIIDLFNLMETNPDIDILAPIQVRRGSDYIMAFNYQEGTDPYDEKVRVFDGPFINGLGKIDSAHFGLTLIRTSSLKKLTKPWFCSKVSKNNDWNKGKKDADVMFWINCKENNLKVRLAELWIGHIQLVCSFASDKKEGYRTVNLPINVIGKSFMPKWARPKSMFDAAKIVEAEECKAKRKSQRKRLKRRR